jgi:RNA 3'-terminal phosphate cyclase (ATP)
VIRLDGSQGGAGGQILRAALALSAVTGQPFEMRRIRERRLRPGLRPHHLAAVRAVAMACRAEVHGDFDGSPELRFAPGAIAAGEFRFEIGASGAATLLVGMLVPVLAAATDGASRVEVRGGTHLPGSPTFHYLARHMVRLYERLALRPRLHLQRAGFAPRGEGLMSAEVPPTPRGGVGRLDLDERGALLAVRGVSGAARLRGEVGRRHASSARALLWERRRVDSEWAVVELPADTPGSFVQVEAVFENGGGAFSFLGQRGVSAELVGERAARRLLRFLDEAGAVDPWAADQLAVPLALAGAGGRITTPEVTAHLETVAAVLGHFGFAARTLGRRGGAGALEVGPV